MASELTPKAIKALACLVAHDGEMGCAQFARAMNYGGPHSAMRTAGQTGASVLRRLQRHGLVEVWDDWFGGTYVTLARITPKGRDALAKKEPGEQHTGSEV